MKPGDDDEETACSLRARAARPDAPVHQPLGVEEVADDRRELEWPVALDAVARTLHADDGRRLAAQELRHVVVVDDGPGQSVHEQHWHPEPRDRLPEVAELGVCAGGGLGAEAGVAPHPAASSRWTALCRMPRRNDDSERPGLCSMVRASSSSKLSKLAGPLTKLVIGAAFSAFTPGVTSTSTSARTSWGAWAASASDDMPPSDIPTTPRPRAPARRPPRRGPARC